MYEAVALFSLWFWVVLFCAIIAICWAASYESPGGTTMAWVFLLVFGLFLFLITDVRDSWFVAWAKDNPWPSVGIFLAYFLCGVPWGFWKWYHYLREKLLKFRENEKDFRDSYKRYDQANTTFAQYMTTRGYPPDPLQNKRLIIDWMTLWIFSLIWDILSLPRKFFKAAFNHMLTSLQRMAQSVFAGQIK